MPLPTVASQTTENAPDLQHNRWLQALEAIEPPELDEDGEPEHKPPPRRLKRKKGGHMPEAHIDALLPYYLVRVLYSGKRVASAEAVGLSYRTVFFRCQRDPEFAAALELVYRLSGDRLVDEAHRRAHDGIPKGVWYKGQCVGFEREYSDQLLQTLLAAHDPRFSRRYQQLGKDGDPVDPAAAATAVILVPAQVSREDWGAFAAEAKRIQDENVAANLEHMRNTVATQEVRK